ncbi:BRCT repeat containing protein [Cryptosporidium meleagridis]
MSKDEDELGQCLLDELFRGNIGSNTDGVNQEILFNEDDEIKKFFESDLLNSSKVLENCEGALKNHNLFSNTISKSTLDELFIDVKEADLGAEVHAPSKMFESKIKNKSTNNILNNIEQTNEEFLQNILSFVGSSSFKSNNKADLKTRVSDKSDKIVNDSNSFLQRKNRWTEKSRNITEIYYENKDQVLFNSNKLDDFMEIDSNIVINREISVKPNSFTNNFGINKEMREKQLNEFDVQNSISLKNDGMVSRSEFKEKDDFVDSNNRLDGEKYLIEGEKLSFSSSFCTENILEKKSDITELADHFQQEKENIFESENNFCVSYSSGISENTSINLERFTTDENSKNNIVGRPRTVINIPISFSTGSGKKVSINEKNLNRAKQILGGSPSGGSPIGSNMPVSFSTGSGKKISIDEESLNRAKKLIGGSPSGRSPIGSNMPVSFSTGSGKKVSIDEESLNKAKKLIGGSPSGRSPIGSNMPVSFSTGSGKKISIDEESLNKAKKLVEGSPSGGSPIGGNMPVSFSTGSGKKVLIDEESLNKAKKLVGGFDNEIENTSITSNKERIKQSLKDDAKLGMGCNVLGKARSNIYPNLLQRNNYGNTINKNNRKLTREELVIPKFFKSYESINYSLACLNSRRVVPPTLILIDHSLQTLKKYTFLLKDTKETEDSKGKYIEVDFRMICDEIENFFIQFPIFPSNMSQYRQRWLEIQYMLILYEECLSWSRKIKTAIKAFIKEFNGFNSIDKTRELLFSNLAQIKYPSIQRILRRICKRAIIEFFDAKRSSLIKICEGDFTVSAPLNLRILSYTDKVGLDEFNNSNTNRIMLCTDGWYIVKIFTNITLIKSLIQDMPRNIFVCGGNWLNSNIEHGHPLEIETSTQDFPLMLYGINLVRPIRKLSGFKLGFHLKPLLFRISKLVNSSEISMISREPNDNEKRHISMDKGGGLSFLVQVIVIHMLPICYKETIETLQDDNRRIFITRDQNEMDISINNEIHEMYEKSLQQPESDSQDSPVENTKRRKISLESKLLVLDYWKFMSFKEKNPQKIEILELINNCSILTLPSGMDIDEITSIKPGTVIRLSWMKVIKNNTIRSLGCSFSKLVPSQKTSLIAKKRVSDDIILTKVIELVRKPVLTFENDPENIIKCKGGWPIRILGLILQVYQIEERKRGFEHCFEFKVLLLTSLGSKIFVRVHSMGSNDSDLRMCERVNNKLKRVFINSGELDYRDFIILIENTEFHSFERSTNLYYFNAKVPYSIFTTPYTLGEKHFSSNSTRRMLSKVIMDLSFHTKCNIPKLFDNHILDENSPHLPVCTNCENKLSECKCITEELIML